MPDISMCGNKTCPFRKQCYRFTAKPNGQWQDYGSFKPKVIPATKYEPEKTVCDFFINNEGRKK